MVVSLAQGHTARNRWSQDSSLHFLTWSVVVGQGAFLVVAGFSLLLPRLVSKFLQMPLLSSGL